MCKRDVYELPRALQAERSLYTSRAADGVDFSCLFFWFTVVLWRSFFYNNVMGGLYRLFTFNAMTSKCMDASIGIFTEILSFEA